jgi:spore maturation protein SpmB
MDSIKMPSVVRIIVWISIIRALITLTAFLLLLISGAQGLERSLMIVFLVYSLASFTIAIALYKGKNWAPVLALIFGTLGIVNMILDPSLVNALISILDILIVSYLFLSRDVQSFFNRNRQYHIS